MSAQKPSDPKYVSLADQIEMLGYFRYVVPERMPRVKALFAKKPGLWAVSVKRRFPADERCLATYGVKDLLREIPPLVRKEIVPLKQMTESLTREGHWITANSQRYDLVSREEMKGLKSKSDMWSIKTPRSLAFINKLFQDAGSDERIYSLHGGSDHWAHILPQAVYDLFLQYQIEGSEELKMYDPLMYGKEL